MKSRQLTLKKGQDYSKLREFVANDTDFGLVFASPAMARDPNLAAAMGGARGIVVGCSTAGEIATDAVEEGTAVCTAVKFEKGTTVRAATGACANANQSYSAGQELARQLRGENLRMIFMLGTGHNVNGSELIRGVTSVVGKEVQVTGGLAGDNFDFRSTTTMLNGKSYTDHAVAIGFYGDHLEISSASQGGWKPFGPPRRVTRAEANVLYELDGQSALSIYETYLGDKAKDLPGSGLLYPFAIVDSKDESIGLIRTILGVDREKGSITLAGDVPANGLLRLMHTGSDGLVEGAERAAEQAARGGDHDQALAILVSCVGRKGVMGEDVEDELDAVRENLPSGTMVTGFYSYGEISPYEKTKTVELHNQTMTITLLNETA